MCNNLVSLKKGFPNWYSLRNADVEKGMKDSDCRYAEKEFLGFDQFSLIRAFESKYPETSQRDESTVVLAHRNKEYALLEKCFFGKVEFLFRFWAPQFCSSMYSIGVALLCGPLLKS